VEVRGHEARPAPLLEELDDHQLAEERPVDGVEKEDAAGPEDAGDLGDDAAHVIHVLQDIAAVHHLEGAVGKRQGLARARPVVDRESLLPRMSLGGRDRLLRGIDSRDVAPQPGKLLGQEAAAAAHVQSPPAARIDPELVHQHPPHVAEAGGVQPPQDVEAPFLLPPGIRHRVVEAVVDGHLSALLQHELEVDASQPWASAKN